MTVGSPPACAPPTRPTCSPASSRSSCYAHPDQNLAELVKLADAEIERLKKDGPTESEVRKAQNQRESDLIMGLQSVTRKAEVLNPYQALYGDPLAYRTELDRVFAVTPEDVRRVARQYLGPNRVELDILPGEPSPRRPPPTRPRRPPRTAGGPSPASEIKDDFDRSAMPPLGPTPRYQPPRFQRRRLSNGLELRVVERHELPIVTVDLVVKSGETLDAQGQGGPRLAGRQPARGGDDVTDHDATGRRAGRDRLDHRRRRRPGIDHRQPDDALAAPRPRPRPVRRRPAESRRSPRRSWSGSSSSGSRT